MSLASKFEGMMKALFKEQGDSLRVEILSEPEVTDFIDAHAAVLDSGFEQVKMSDKMRESLQKSDWMFSGIKTFHELNEAFPQLTDEDGGRKPFERFLNDVRKVDETYNRNYLRAEYNFAQASAEMAGKWERIEEDGDEYLLQYRTAGDDKVRPEHASLNGVTLPPSDTFWDEYYPPNGWNCRCSVAQVRRDKFPQTDREEAFTRARKALAKDENGMFRFNPGKQERTFPDYNPYTISKCKNCPKAKNLAAGIPENELCEACELLSVRMVNSVGHASDRIVEYDQEQWEHTYISTQADGLVVTEHGRIAESEINEKEKAKYKKELSMCFDIADNGHYVEFLHGENRPKGQTFDIRIDGIPADLKFIEESGSNIPRYAKYAFRNQGAEIVVFRLSSHSAYDKIKEAHRKYGAEGQIYFYFADDTRLRRIKKRGQ